MSSEAFAALLGRMTRAICAGDEFSYVSKLAGAEDRQAGFSGTCFCTLERAPVLAQLGFPDERIVKSVRRWAKPGRG